MKIKQLGNVKPWSLEVTCSKCNAILTLDSPHDIGVIQLRGGRKDFYYAVCPICGTVLGVDEQAIPSELLKAIDWV